MHCSELTKINEQLRDINKRLKDRGFPNILQLWQRDNIEGLCYTRIPYGLIMRYLMIFKELNSTLKREGGGSYHEHMIGTISVNRSLIDAVDMDNSDLSPPRKKTRYC